MPDAALAPLEALEASWTSLLPALVTILLAFATRQVLPALFAGIATGGVVLFLQTGLWTDLNPITRFFLPALGSQSYAKILLIYLWCLGGLIGLWTRTGAARHFALTLGARFSRTREQALFAAWTLGCVFHQGGTVSTVLTGSTIKPLADARQVSHEELAYVVDSTSSPIATILPFNAWPIYVAGLVVGTIPLFPDAEAGRAFFFSSLWFNFYGWFAVISTLLFCFGLLPWTGGQMKRARSRSIAGRGLDRPGAEPLLVTVEEDERARDYQPSLADFLIPLALLLSISIVPSALGYTSRINEAFAIAVLSAMAIAGFRGMPMKEILDGFVGGCAQMTIGAIVLGLAVTIGMVSKELHTAQFLVDTVASAIHPIILPALLTGLCMIIAFATGTSWGTYAVVFPIGLPLAYALAPDPTYVQVCFGAILGGAVYGDQCSPISDTTILSSMFTGCDLMDHVRTQLPLASAAAGLGVVASTGMAWAIL